jgi:hypothetical protein
MLFSNSKQLFLHISLQNTKQNGFNKMVLINHDKFTHL